MRLCSVRSICVGLVVVTRYGGNAASRVECGAISTRQSQSGATRPRELNVMEESEARKRFGDSLVIASLGVWGKD